MKIYRNVHEEYLALVEAHKPIEEEIKRLQDLINSDIKKLINKRGTYSSGQVLNVTYDNKKIPAEIIRIKGEKVGLNSASLFDIIYSYQNCRRTRFGYVPHGREREISEHTLTECAVVDILYENPATE